MQLGEVETLLSSEDTGRDLPSIENLLKKHQLLEADIGAHADRLAEMDTQADALLEAEQFDRDQIDERRNAIKNRYANVKRLATERRDKLNKALNVHQFLRDVDEEESFLTGCGRRLSSPLALKNQIFDCRATPSYRKRRLWSRSWQVQNIFAA